MTAPEAANKWQINVSQSAFAARLNFSLPHVSASMQFTLHASRTHL